MSSPYANLLVLLLAAALIATLLEFSWLNGPRFDGARFSELFFAARAGRLEPAPDEEMVQIDTDRARYDTAMRLRRNPGN